MAEGNKRLMRRLEADLKVKVVPSFCEHVGTCHLSFSFVSVRSVHHIERSLPYFAPNTTTQPTHPGLLYTFPPSFCLRARAPTTKKCFFNGNGLLIFPIPMRTETSPVSDPIWRGSWMRADSERPKKLLATICSLLI